MECRADASGTIRYLYAGANLFAELDGAGVVRRAYSYFPGVDQPHAVQVDTAQASQRYFYATEAPGHVAGLFKASNNIVDEYRYSAFGEAQAAQESVPQPLRYMARELDAGTGLYQVRARWYDPELERFVSEDPIGLSGGINAYAYAANDPVNLTDPAGLCPGWKAANIGWGTADGEPFNPCPAEVVPAPASGLGDLWIAARAGRQSPGAEWARLNSRHDAQRDFERLRAHWAEVRRQESLDTAIPWHSDPIFHALLLARGGGPFGVAAKGFGSPAMAQAYRNAIRIVAARSMAAQSAATTAVTKTAPSLASRGMASLRQAIPEFTRGFVSASAPLRPHARGRYPRIHPESEQCCWRL